MAFFSEVKAKLGLDITPFERGLSNAAKVAQASTGEIGKGFASIKGLIGFTAISAGFSNALTKAQEMRDKAAELGTALDPAVQRTADLADNLERAKSDLSEGAAVMVGGLQRGVDYVVAALGQITGMSTSINEGIEAIDKARAQAGSAKAQEKRDKAAAEASKKADQAEMERSKKAAATFQKYSEMKEARRQKELTFDQRIAEQRAQISMLEATINDTSKDAETIGSAKLAREEALAKLAEIQKQRADEVLRIEGEWAKFNEKRAQAEKDRTDALKAQKKLLEEQRNAVKQTLADYESGIRKSLLPTTEDVKSGKRKIGTRARSQASDLDRAQAEAQSLSDAEQRKRDELENPGLSKGDRDRIVAEGRAIRARKEAALGRAEKLKGGLEGRVSDIETNRKSLDQLKEINAGIGKLNTSLAPKALKK